MRNKDVKFIDLFNFRKPRASKEKALERFNVCVGCERFDLKFERCLECGCFMRLKTTLEDASCPLGKW